MRKAELIKDERLLEIFEKYKPENFKKLMEFTFPSEMKKLKVMNNKEAGAAIKAAQKAQKEAANQSFKQNARVKALEVAQYMGSRVVISEAPASKEPKYNLIAEAEKIYQWLVKVLK